MPLSTTAQVIARSLCFHAAQSSENTRIHRSTQRVSRSTTNTLPAISRGLEALNARLHNPHSVVSCFVDCYEIVRVGEEWFALLDGQ